MRKSIFWSCVVLPLAIGSASAGEPDVVMGKRQFAPCGACHALTADGANRVGPNLYKVLGRKAGSKADYAYSNALKKSNIVWDEQKIDKYITKPGEFLPGNKMAYPGVPTPEARANIIAYIKEASK